MTTRPTPSRPSHYVGRVLRPLADLQTSFSEVEGSESLARALREEVAGQVTARYGETASELLRTVQQTESSLQRLKERKVSSGRTRDGAPRS